MRQRRRDPGIYKTRNRITATMVAASNSAIIEVVVVTTKRIVATTPSTIALIASVVPVL